jgi:hypothetical protein
LRLFDLAGDTAGLKLLSKRVNTSAVAKSANICFEVFTHYAKPASIQ